MSELGIFFSSSCALPPKEENESASSEVYCLTTPTEDLSINSEIAAAIDNSGVANSNVDEANKVRVGQRGVRFKAEPNVIEGSFELEQILFYLNLLFRNHCKCMLD